MVKGNRRIVLGEGSDRDSPLYKRKVIAIIQDSIIVEFAFKMLFTKCDAYFAENIL